MIRSTAFLLVLAITASVPGAARERTALTLAAALQQGREHSHALRASRARAEGVSARADEASSALFPSLKVDASYRRLSSVPSFSVALPFAGASPVTIFPMIPDNYQLRASLQQPLFTGFRLSSAASAARLQAEASEQDVRSDASELTVTITAAYWTVFQAREMKASADENITRLESYERDTRNLVGAGMATRNDLLRIQVQLQQARLGRIDAASDLELAQASLNLLIGRSPDDSLALASVPDSSAVPEPGVAAGVTERSPQESVRTRPDLAAMEVRVEAAREALQAARGGFFPQLMLSANYYYAKPNQRYLPALNRWKDSWDVGVLLQFDLWNWGGTAAQAEQARAALQASQETLEQLRQNVSLEVRRADLAFRRSGEKLAVARLGVAQAEENSRILTDKYRSGLATSSELLDASLALVQARSGYTGAQVEREITRVRLRKALGVL